LTTLKIGGDARYFVRAEAEEQVVDAVRFAEDRGLTLFVLGGGSNIVVSDAGFDGVVLQIGLKGRQLDYTGNDVSIAVGAGENWDELVEFCVSNDLAGLECLSGIPGFVGGTPIQNVGAYGQEVSESIMSVRCFDRESRKIVELSNDDCCFSYRTSIFNSTARDRYIVLVVTFSLTKGGEPKIAYKDIIDIFAGQRPALKKVRDVVLQIRRSKSMVIDAADENRKSAGSFFKNPIVEAEKLRELKSLNAHVSFFAFGEKFKIPAAWLIENAGFCRGFAIGNAGISTNHTLALINRGGATAAEMIFLKDTIQQTVARKFGIDLQPEPVFVGF